MSKPKSSCPKEALKLTKATASPKIKRKKKPTTATNNFGTGYFGE